MYRHVWAEINLNALRHNAEQIAKIVPREKIVAVIKANAYGHGAKAVAEELISCGINKFAVSDVYEALDLRACQKKGEVYLLGYSDPLAADELIENNITACIFDVEYAKMLNSSIKNVKKLKCHIKLDTGMGRIGFNCRNGFNEQQFEDEISKVFALENLEINGAFTHFAVADCDGDENAEFTASQYELFKKGTNIIKAIGEKSGKTDFVFHCSNSAATLLDNSFSSDMYRAGIILYGLTPSAGLNLPIELKPVMTLKALVTQIKTVDDETSLSYGRTYKTSGKRKIATINIGYADGYSRTLSNKGEVAIKGKKFPIVGRICMDQMMVDITDEKDINLGDTVTLFGEEILPVEELTEKIGTINYELVCAVSRRVTRVYIKDGKEVKLLRYRSL